MYELTNETKDKVTSNSSIFLKYNIYKYTLNIHANTTMA